jgi:hypothetical protein
MTKPDWPSIKRDYVETTLTLAQVQAKWGVRRGTLSARATRENWHDQKQQFAAKLEQARREKIIAKTTEERAKFQGAVIRTASVQLGMIMRKMHEFAPDAAADAEKGKREEKGIDVASLLKLTNALANVQRIGFTALGIGTGRVGAAPDAAAGDPADDPNGSGGARPTARVSAPRASPVTSDVLNALTALGYSDREAATAVKQVPEGLAVDDAIRQALKLLATAQP